jgi:hypothetical protein
VPGLAVPVAMAQEGHEECAGLKSRATVWKTG